jgi:hypothetical protein
MMRIGLLMVPVLVAGCATMAPPPALAGPCKVDERLRARFVGVKFRETMRAETQALAHASVVRVLRPDDVATMDFRPDRLHILLDDGAQIEGFRCG